MKKVYLGRLKMARDILKVIPDKDFDQCSFGRSCGTVGCVAFHYIRIANPADIELRGDGRGSQYLVPQFVGKRDTPNPIVYVLAPHFGITPQQSDDLFGGHDRTKQEAISVFDKFIRERSKR